jgi:hypothetical protein
MLRTCHAPATLESALGFTAGDLAANRAARLGPRQLFNARFYAAVWSIMGALFLLAMGVALWAQVCNVYVLPRGTAVSIERVGG